MSIDWSHDMPCARNILFPIASQFFLTLISERIHFSTPPWKHFLLISDDNDSYYRQELIILAIPNHFGVKTFTEYLKELLIMWMIFIHNYILEIDF